MPWRGEAANSRNCAFRFRSCVIRLAKHCSVHVTPTQLKRLRDVAKIPERYGVLPVTGYIRQSQLIPAIFPFSPATLWRKVKAGSFPKPVKLGPRITAWRVEEICELLQREVWVPQNRTSPNPKTRVGAPSLSTSEEVASRLTSNCEDPNVPSLTLRSGSEIESRRPQTDSADSARSLLSPRRVRAR